MNINYLISPFYVCVVIISNKAVADDLHMLSYHCVCADRQLLVS